MKSTLCAYCWDEMRPKNNLKWGQISLLVRWHENSRVMCDKDTHFSLLFDCEIVASNTITSNISLKLMKFCTLTSAFNWMSTDRWEGKGRGRHRERLRKTCMLILDMLLKLSYSDKIKEDQRAWRSNQKPNDQKDKSDDKEISKVHEERWFFGEWKAVSADEIRMNNVRKRR